MTIFATFLIVLALAFLGAGAFVLLVGLIEMSGRQVTAGAWCVIVGALVGILGLSL